MKVKVLTPLSHDSSYYERGDVLELPDQVAEELSQGQYPTVSKDLNAPIPGPADPKQQGEEPTLKNPEETGGKGAFNKKKGSSEPDPENPVDEPQVPAEPATPEEPVSPNPETPAENQTTEQPSGNPQE